jgi:hypothetical protein
MIGARVAALAFAILSPAGADPVAIAEAFAAELLPAFKDLDVKKLEALYTPTCVFGNPDAGEAGQQEDVLMTGMKKVGLDHASKAFRDEVKAMKVMSAVEGVGQDKIIAWVKVEVDDCQHKKSCKDSAFYHWTTLVPSEKTSSGWATASVLMSSAPVSSTAELLEQPLGNAMLPGPLALVATFASGVFLSGCFLGRKEIVAKLRPQEPLIA